MDENQKSKFVACSEELCQLDPLALSAHRPYPRNSPLCSGNEPVLAAVGSLCASHHFSTRELLLVFASLNSFPHPSWLGGVRTPQKSSRTGGIRLLQQPCSH